MTARLVVEGASVSYRQPGRSLLTAVGCEATNSATCVVGSTDSSRSKEIPRNWATAESETVVTSNVWIEMGCVTAAGSIGSPKTAP